MREEEQVGSKGHYGVRGEAGLNMLSNGVSKAGQGGVAVGGGV